MQQITGHDHPDGVNDRPLAYTFMAAGLAVLAVAAVLFAAGFAR
ncbi:hypothetical protein [Jatrophihabitans sp.]|nr:hypothetical protein [Jatrophihabitans sp.]